MEAEADDPLEDILSDSQWESPQEGADDDIVDFGVEMPEFERSPDEDIIEVQDEEDQQESLQPSETKDDMDVNEDETAPPLHDIESEAEQINTGNEGKAKPDRSKLKKWMAPMGVAACFALLSVGSIYFRTAISGYIPALAPVYSAIGLPVNLLGIEFAGIQLKQKYENGFPILSVEGEVINISGRQRRVPDVRLSLQGPGGAEVYHWSINIGRAALEPDQRVKFVTRLASPPEEARKIVIRFNTMRRRMGAL